MQRLILLSFLLMSCATTSHTVKQSELFKSELLRISDVCETLNKCEWAQKNLSDIPHELFIMQGPTSARVSQLTVVAPRENQLSFWLSDEHTEIHKINNLKKVSWADQSYSVWQVSVDRFGSGDDFRIVVTNDQNKIVDVREFRFWNDTSSSALKVVLASCLDDFYLSSMQKNWNKVKELEPDVILMTGDNVYVDKWGEQKLAVQSGDDIWKRYVDNRRALPFFKFSQLIPVYAIWDDHDFGKNDGDETWALKDASFKVFRAFFPQPFTEGVYQPGPGVSGRLTLRGTSWLLLDSRSYRSPNTTRAAGELGQASLTHFGGAQERWMNDKNQRTQAPQFWVSGDQWFGAHHEYESFENNHPKKFDSTIDQLKKEKRKVVFISGDRHISEIQKLPFSRLGYQTFEITSSPMHGKFTPGILTKYRSPLSVADSEGASQFMLLTVTPLSQKLSLKIENWTDSRGKTIDWSQEIQ